MMNKKTHYHSEVLEARQCIGVYLGHRVIFQVFWFGPFLGFVHTLVNIFKQLHFDPFAHL